MLTAKNVQKGADNILELTTDDLSTPAKNGKKQWVQWDVPNLSSFDLMADLQEYDNEEDAAEATAALLMPEDIIMPWKAGQKTGPTSAQYGLYYLQGKDKHGNDAKEGETVWDDELQAAGPLYVVDVPQIRRNIYILCKSLMQYTIDFSRWRSSKQRNSISHIKLSSTLRWPQYNKDIGGAKGSRHQYGLAADVWVYDSNGQIAPSECQRFAEIWAPGVTNVKEAYANIDQTSGEGEDGENQNVKAPFADLLGENARAKTTPVAPRFEKARTYGPGKGGLGFTHLAISKVAPRTFMGKAHLTNHAGSRGRGRMAHANGAQGVVPGAVGNYEVNSAFHDVEGNETESLTVVSGLELENSLRQMYAQMGFDLDREYETYELPDRGAPDEGEIDIGDLRFGARRFREHEPADLNQPTAVSQQNAGSVATASMLRADMDAVIADSTVLPEVIVTLSINATTRDDVNNRIRPLIAMQKRSPFVPVRGREFSRLMFGIGGAEDIESRLAELYPSLTREELEERASDIAKNAADAWVPSTIRQVNVATQPGAAGMFQVHVVLRFANISPYAPQMKFWKRSNQALEWARYLSIRSHQGGEVVGSGATDRDPGEGGRQKVLLKDNSVIEAVPPDLTQQTESPYQSYPFRKFYRGLLEEYDPSLYYLGGGETQEPLFRTGENQVPVKEPAYAMSDPARAFERYNPEAALGFEYISIQGRANAGARLQAVIQGFTETINQANRLDAALTLGKFGEDFGEADLREQDSISPYIAGPGRQLARISLSLQQTAKAYESIQDKLQSKLNGNLGPTEQTFNSFGIDLETGGVSEEEHSVDFVKAQMERAGLSTSMQESRFAQDIFRAAEEASGGGLVNFRVPDGEFQDIHVPFTEVLRKKQRAIIQLQAKFLIAKGSYLVDDDDGNIRGAFQNLLFGEAKRVFDSAEEWPNGKVPSDTPTKLDQYPPAFGRYMLTYDFMRFFKQNLTITRDKDKDLFDTETRVKPDGEDKYTVGQLQGDIKDLFRSSQELSGATYDSVNGAREAITTHFQQQAEDASGFLSLEASSVERIRVENGSKLVDQEWDGYESPVTQHLGGRNAYVTIELTTNNQLLIDKLGEIKRSQERLSSIRKSANVVPPLMAVTGRGNLLRSFGIKHVAYRSHSVNMAKNNPGYYKVRLDLVQDEKTLARKENIGRLGGGGRDLKLESLASAPLVIPFRYEEEGDKQPKLFSLDMYRLFRKVYSNLRGETGLPQVDPVNEQTPKEAKTEPKLLVDTEAYEDAQLVGGEEENTLWIRNKLEGVNVDIERERNQTNEGDIQFRPFRFTATFTFRTEDGVKTNRGPVEETDDGLERRAGVDITDYLRPLKSFLEFADRQMQNREEFVRLVQTIESALSTSGGRRGLIQSWVGVAEARMAEIDLQIRSFGEKYGDAVDARRQWTGPILYDWLEPYIGSTARSVLDQAPYVDLPVALLSSDTPSFGERPSADNLTEAVRRILDEEENRDTENVVRFRQMPFFLAASEITAALTTSQETYSVYTAWLGEYENPSRATTQVKYPYGPDEMERTYDKDPVLSGPEGGEELKQSGAIVQIYAQQQRLATALPTAYEDLLMPKIVDHAQGGAAVLAPDFPFGPGREELGEDIIYERFEVADAMRTIAATRMATLGFDAAREYLGRTPAEAKENTPALAEAFNGAMQDLYEAASDQSRQLVHVPFDINPDGGEGKPFNDVVQRLENNGAFSAFPVGAVHSEELVEAYRLSKSFEYVTMVIEAARMAGEGGRSAPGSDIPDVRKFMQSLEEGEGDFSIDLGSMASVRQNTAKVGASSFLASKREELIQIYQADPETIQRALGFHDRFSEPRREALKNKLKRTWFDWKGMRQAFPSYMLILTGKAGTGLFSVMSDRYSWTAVQSLDIVKNTDAAGGYGTLVLSNMRSRLRGPERRVQSQIYDRKGGFDQEMELRPGNHVVIYHGYGPDVAHMKPFAGRVTAVQPGTQTVVEVSSYSTTLNNPPSGGQGFFIDGWNGQQTIANAILYNIANTSGLEGLGRQSPGTALDAMGRTNRGFADRDFRASMMMYWYNAFGSPMLGSVTGGAEADVGTILKMVGQNYGAGAVKSAVLGDPQIFENIYVTSDPERGGWGTLLNGFDDYMTEGKGWGWAALPGETCWAQLKDQAMLFTDFVVTPRMYNGHIPLEQSATHPIRQTLYFGKKTGNYIYTSRQPATTQGFMQPEDEAGDPLETVFEDQNLDQVTVDGKQNPKLIEYFDEIFIRRGFLKTALEVTQAGVDRDAGDRLRRGINRTNPFADIRGELEYIDYEGGTKERITRKLKGAFPNLMNEINSRLVDLNISTIVDDYLESPSRKYLEAFQKDLRHMARQGRNSIPDIVRANPLIDALYRQSLRNGLRPGKHTRPIQEHHFVDMYRKAAKMEIQAGDSHPQFANRVTLSFPNDPDERLSAYAGASGSMRSYEMTVSPTINEDFIVEDQVYYPNVRANYQEAAGKIASSLKIYDTEIETLPNLAEVREDALEKQREGKTNYTFEGLTATTIRTVLSGYYKTDDGDPLSGVKTDQAINIISRTINKILSDVEPYYSSPKYSTVATNLLRDRFKHMYSGTILMRGSPNVDLYHILHTWNDVDEVFGPVEVNSVRHTMSAQSGYYTEVEPKLVTFVRGADEGLDVEWMSWAAKTTSAYNNYLHVTGALSQIGSGVATASIARPGLRMFGNTIAKLSTKSAIPVLRKFAANSAIKKATQFLGQRIALGAAAGSTTGGLGTILVAIYTAGEIVYTLGGIAGDIRERQMRTYIGLVQGSMDANPLVFLPLSRGGSPYTAGLTGSTGPASLTEVTRDVVEGGVEAGANVEEIINAINSTVNAANRAPTTGE